jgi:sec-independent protein translocase protein TatC
MKVSEHITAVRNILLRAGLIGLATFILTFLLSNRIIEWLIQYFSLRIYAFSPFESLNAQFYLSIGITAILFIPYFLTEIYVYAKDEFKIPKFWRTISISYLLAVGGFILGSIFISKQILEIFKETSLFYNMWSALSVLSISITTGLAVAAALQLFIIIPLLTKLGILSYSDYTKQRIYIIVGLLLIVTFITPDPTMVSAGLLMVPILGSLEGGFMISRFQTGTTEK